MQEVRLQTSRKDVFPDVGFLNSNLHQVKHLLEIVNSVYVYLKLFLFFYKRLAD
jgi:hypothetical protein